MAKKEIKHPGVEISELYTNNIKTNISIYVKVIDIQMGIKGTMRQRKVGRG